MYRCVVITDDKTVILCIRIINILLKLSEWVNCLPSVGHRRICSCHRELCINSVTSPFLGTRGLDGSMRGGQFRCPPPQIASLGKQEWSDQWGPHHSKRDVISPQNISSETCWIFPESQLSHCLVMEDGLCSPACIWVHYCLVLDSFSSWQAQHLFTLFFHLPAQPVHDRTPVFHHIMVRPGRESHPWLVRKGSRGLHASRVAEKNNSVIFCAFLNGWLMGWKLRENSGKK